MEQTENKNEQVAYCGLYCAQCRKFKMGKCSGCRKNDKNSWCKIRSCCIENNYDTCADCKKMALKDCRKFNNLFSKIFALVFNSDRCACIERIKEVGQEQFAQEMAQQACQTIKKKKKK